MTIGERIKKRREEIKMSVIELASILNKARTTIYRYENNFIENVPYVILIDIAKALKTTPAYLMGWSDEITATEKKDKITIDFASGESKEYFLTAEKLKEILNILQEGGGKKWKN